MLFNATILADSISPEGKRLTTFELTFPRIILSELNTHRTASRNSASSRAIPVKKQIRKIIEEPFIPREFGINKPGMQAASYLTGVQFQEAVRIQKKGAARAVRTALEFVLGEAVTQNVYNGTHTTSLYSDTDLQERIYAQLDDYEAAMKVARKNGEDTVDTYLNVHKQTANRGLEAYMSHTVIISATEWSNFWALRTHEDAQPEIRTIAQMAKELYDASTPTLLQPGEWHLPLLSEAERKEAAEILTKDPSNTYWLKVSAGRCARVSYLTHDGLRDLSADILLCERLVSSGHMSPLEHVATPSTTGKVNSNFIGWEQLRKKFPHEDDYGQIINGK